MLLTYQGLFCLAPLCQTNEHISSLHYDTDQIAKDKFFSQNHGPKVKPRTSCSHQEILSLK